MGLYKQLPSDIEEVDVIVAGGGTTGCVVASRLASASPARSVLVIEGGKDNFDEPSVKHMGLFLSHIMPGAPMTLFYQTKPSNHLSGRDLVIPSGGVLGGGSSINMGMYSRAQRSDFNAWDTPGWSTDEMLPYLKKLETFNGKGSPETHGYDGPIQVSRGPWSNVTSENDFIIGAGRAGYSEVEDVQSLDKVNVFGRANRYVSAEGIRQDAAHSYLHPRLRDGKHPNLHVVVESQVSRVIIDNGRATGVVFRSNPKFQTDSAAERTVRARKLVVVSCGALGTPLVLERSGIGRPDVISKARVPISVENLGVGVGYEDHQVIATAYKTSLGDRDTLSDLLFGKLDFSNLAVEWPEVLGYNLQDAQGKIRPTDEEAAALGPTFKEAWDAHFKNKQDKPVVAMALINGFPGMPGEGILPGAYLGLTTFSLYPFSRGSIHITGPSIDSPVDFDPGFLADPHGIDVKKHIWAYKRGREIMRRMPCYRGEVASWHPPFSKTSQAALVDSLDGPLPEDAPDLKYSEDDDKVLEQFIREKADTTWHSMGTCKMKPREQGGAVDSSLGVYGVEGLKLADLSICPQNIGANLNNTALAVGEKAADIFIKELGLV